MRFDRIYLLGVGNFRGHMAINFAQFVFFMLTINMEKPVQGIIIALTISSVLSMFGMIFVQFSQQEKEKMQFTDTEEVTLKTKFKVFHLVMGAMYVIDLFLMGILYMGNILAAPYFLITGPACLLIFLLIIMMHDNSVRARYNYLRNTDWVLDYNGMPTVRTVSKTINVSVKMFTEDKVFIASAVSKPIPIKKMFQELTPGSKITKNQISHPRFQELSFTNQFIYSSMHVGKCVYIRKETREDQKRFNLYIKVLSDYLALYKVEKGAHACVHCQMNIYGNKQDIYIEPNEYITRFIPSKEIELAYISIQLNPDFASIPLKKFVKMNGIRIRDYLIWKEENNLYLKEPGYKSGTEAINISYLQQYMSFNLAEYAYNPDAIDEDDESYHEKDPVGVSISDFYSFKKKEAPVIAEKRLYRIKGLAASVYVFLEDLKSLSELDEIIMSNFINRDIEEAFKAQGLEMND